MSVVAVVPARAGSKGVPGKNLALVAGKPLIAWTIEAAIESGVAERVLVSTDSAQIAEVALRCGAEVPWLRPPVLAADDTPLLDVARHAIEAIEQGGHPVEWLLLLQPTSPLRTAEDIRNAFKLARAHDADSVVGVTQSHVHPAWLFTIGAEGGLERSRGVLASAERQQRETYYAPNGAIYLIKANLLRGGGTWYGAGALAYVMPAERSLDVDTPWDLRVARLILEHHDTKA